ncbi:uncharacterized protein CLUP02_06308 [Colletotrichum lupini]|uniref:O-methyltransferase domain-containing protein n=1 Tax=Colletotrichum lupini TaxID=145971 RepID=A0A9Q8SPD5_9PEZI|nr:uncharacterized protein CLUP02_06308 [Colletotrichum lupini]UQC80823.1 hypothetical protein CLUP02_06308 [Colletotrichum lupini]
MKKLPLAEISATKAALRLVPVSYSLGTAESRGANAVALAKDCLTAPKFLGRSFFSLVVCNSEGATLYNFVLAFGIRITLAPRRGCLRILFWVYNALFTVLACIVNPYTSTFFLDVAGGLGHDIDDFKKMYSNHPGDLPVVINDVEGIDTSIELMRHDFLTEQPIKGERPTSCTQSCTTGQMTKLLIFEVVVPRTGAYWEATAGDILMMTQLSALERTEDHWHQLVKESGLNLRIVNF